MSPGSRHALHIHGIVVENLKDVVDGAQDVASLRSAFHVSLDVEFDVVPRFLNLFDALHHSGCAIEQRTMV